MHAHRSPKMPLDPSFIYLFACLVKRNRERILHMYNSNRNNRVPLDTLIFIIHVQGSIELDQVIKVLFGTASFTGGFIGFLLDNIVPGK